MPLIKIKAKPGYSHGTHTVVLADGGSSRFLSIATGLTA